VDLVRSSKVDYFLAVRPLWGYFSCGDTGIIKEFNHKVFLGLIDVLGHGEEAYKLAVKSRNFLSKNYHKDLVEIIKALHEHIKGTRGEVIGLCLLDILSGNLRCAGIGNISVRSFGSSCQRVIFRSGIVGYMMPNPREEILQISAGDVVLMYSDGVRDHFRLEDYPGLLKDNAKTIARNIVKKFGKNEDDASCISLRYKDD